MVDVADAVVAHLAVPVAAVMPLLAARVPAGPAADLGRLGAPEEATLDHRALRAGPARPRGYAVRPAPAHPVHGSPVLDALQEVGPLRCERLLGALELTVAGLELTGTPDLSPYLGPPPSGHLAVMRSSQDCEAAVAAATVEQVRPGVLALAAELSRRLAADPRIAGLLAVDGGAGGEAAIAAAHGAAYLALAVASAAAVVGQVGAPVVDRPAAVVGVGLGCAVPLLHAAPMPAGYRAAVLAKVRAGYVLPRHSAGPVPVAGHRFALAEGPVPDVVDVSGNGLVAVVDGGAVIRTGIAEGSVRVMLTVLAGPPPSVAPGWEEVVEVSWRAAEGRASVVGPDGTGAPALYHATPPWPGDYRLRVHARGRDDAEETYELVVWPAPPAPQIVHARTDRLGHRLRGEPEPVRPDRPEDAYRWIRHSALGMAATVTVATGATVTEVLAAFGADPTQPESIRAIDADRSTDPWVAVLDARDAVLVVEVNGFQGAQEPVLSAASAGGRAASMFWNVNAVTRLSLAERGRVLASFEPWTAVDAGPAVAAALAGLDTGDYGDKVGNGLVAVQRFTGRGITAEDLASILAADIGFRVVPHLPVLYPHRPGRATVQLDLDSAALAQLPGTRLRELAWWAAAEAARYTGLAGDPDVAASIAARALTPEAQWRARRSQLRGGQHRWMWLALHRATNPDPVAAVVDTLDAARFAAGPHAAELVADARARIAAP